MEFTEMLNLFTCLKNYARKKYPMSVTYTKYLQKLDTDKNYTKQNDEVDLLKKFLVANQEIDKKTLTCEEFHTGKSGTIINMRNFIIDGHIDTFWNNIIKINDVLFPDGKPDTQSFEAEMTTDNIFKQFQNNRLLTDTFEQIKKVDIKNINNVSQLLESEVFQGIINKLSTSFSDGTYSMNDVASLTTNIGGVVDTLANSNSLDESTKEKLKIVSEALGCMQNKKEFDVNRLLKVIGSIDLKKPQ